VAELPGRRLVLGIMSQVESSGGLRAENRSLLGLIIDTFLVVLLNCDVSWRHV